MRHDRLAPFAHFSRLLRVSSPPRHPPPPRPPFFSSASVVLASGDSVTVLREHVSVSVKSELVHTAKYTPHVIEPAFGIGRIFYAILEHTFYVRPPTGAAAAAPAAAAAAPAKASKSGDKAAAASADVSDDRRSVFSLPPMLAPMKLSILPLSSNSDFVPFQRQLAKAAVDLNVSFKVDASAGSIGRRYAKSDEIGVPFGITIDFQTKEDQTVTIRERDSMQQIRLPLVKAVPLVASLANGQTTWAEAYETHDKFSAGAQE